MRRTKIKLMAVGTIITLACGGWIASARAERKTGATVSGVAVDAHTVYSRHCASCHGEDGDANTDKGQLYGATNFTDKNWWAKERPTDASLRRAIANGKRGGMPAFAKRISAQEIDALVSYIKGFKGK